MDPAAVQYVTALQQARSHEKDRRNLRRRRRNEYLAAIQEDFTQLNRAALNQHIQRQRDTRSQMERNLVDFVHKTAVWWGALCDQSIEQRLRYEKSVEDQKIRRQEYLSNVEKRENSEYLAVCKSENARWQTMQEEFREYEKDIQTDMIDAVRKSVVEATEECVRLMNDYVVENAKDNLLIQFAFKKVTEKAQFSKKSENLHFEAFKCIFGTRNAYGLTGLSFKELLDFSYQWCDADKRATYEFDACQVPIILLEGAKLSGKSLLADALEKKFQLHRFNDRSLIEKALETRLEEPQVGSKESREDFTKTAAYTGFNDLSGTPTGDDGSSPYGSCDAQQNESTAAEKRDFSGESQNTLNSASTASPDADKHSDPHSETLGEQEPEANGDGWPMKQTSAEGSAISSRKTEKSPSPSNRQWVEIGSIIREKLYRGEAIDQSMTARLLQLQLQDMRAEDCNGVIFEGVLNRVVEIPSLLDNLVPKRTNRYEELYNLWCEGLEEALAERARQQEEEEALAADAAAAAAAEADAAAAEAAAEMEAAKQNHGRSPRKKHRSGSRASMQTTTSALDALQPPTPPPEDVPAILNVARVKLDEPVKKEVRSKGAKRGVDLSQLPPPELPPVEDITEEVKREEEFVARALEELQSYTGLLSCIMYVNCSQEEIFRRFAGLRIDRDTSEQYHLVYNPPPKSRVPYLIGCDRTTSFSSVLYDVVFRQKQEWEELKKWFLRQPSLCNRVHEIEGEQTMEAIEHDAEELVQRALDMFNVGKRLYDSMLEARERIAMLQRKREEQVAAREAERVRLAELYTEKGVPLPPELEITGDVGSWCPTPTDVPPMVLKVVQEFHDKYGQTYQAAWNEFSSLSCMILEYRRSARSQLKRFWGQPDDKQSILDRFLRQFNGVPKRFRCKPPCKEELHLLTDELSTELFACVEAKRKDGLALIDHVVRRDAYLDGWEANVCNIGALLVQQEVERFTLVVNLSMLYFAAALEEPVMFEEVDTEVSLIRALEATGDLGGGSKNKADKRSVGARKGHGRPNEESGDSSILEAFNETVLRLVNAVTSLTEKFKLKVSADASGKGQKKVTLRSLKLSAITSCCTPFLETEQTAALDRIANVKRFITELARQGEAYMQSIKLEMMGEARQMLMKQAGAVNSAVFAIRCAIEEEDEVSPMHIGCGTFAILKPKERDYVALANAVKTPCFITDVPLYAKGGDLITPIHDTLNGSRLLEMIQLFRCAAPKYQLCRDSFTTIVSDEDYAGAAKDGEYILGTSEVFRLFDPMGTGVMDWRELVMHLLFWCSPPGAKGEVTKYIPEATIEELIAMKKHLFQAPVTEDHFRECPFFFDKYLKADRRDVYVRALWYSFQRAEETTIDPFDILCFFCIDKQPIRGIQKAFCVFSDGSELLTMKDIERILHVRATNARALALLDPFSKPNLYLLLGPRTIISFKDTCTCAMGRYIFNRFDFMMRKTFVSAVS